MPDRKIRVALVVRPAAGGINQHIRTLLSHLDYERFAPTLFAGTNVVHERPQTAFQSLCVASRLDVGSDYRAVSTLIRALRGKFDLVHAHGIRAAWIAAHAAPRVGLPFLFTAHNLVPNLGRISRAGLQWTAQRSTRIIAVSQAVARTLTENGVSDEKITVVPNGVELAPFDAPFDAEAFIQWKTPGEKPPPLLIVAGRLAPEKGFTTLLQAFAQVQMACPSAVLLLLGDGPLQLELEAQAAKIPNVELVGRVENVVPYLRLADVVVVPSLSEGQGIVALEAMAARKPVVASRVGGLVETVIDGETGLLVPSENPRLLAEAILLLLNDKAKAQAMGEAGRKRVEEDYLAADMVRRIEDVYAKVAGS